jgi:two-component system chemotaxis response regulator CheB
MAPARFRCRVGHAWTAEALLEAQGSAWERALWAAVRALDEKALLGRRMVGYAQERGSSVFTKRYQQAADEAASAAEVLRRSLTTVLGNERGEPER